MKDPHGRNVINKNRNSYSKRKKKQKKSRVPKILGICILVGLYLVFILTAVKLYTVIKEKPGKKDFDIYIAYDDQFLDKEEKYLNEDGYVRKEDIPQLLDDVEEVVQKGKNEGVIKSYTRDSGNIFIEFSSGISYLFIPVEQDTLSNGEGEKILTVEPSENDISVNLTRMLTVIDKYYNKLEYTGSYTPVADANLIQETYNSIYEDKDLVPYKYSLQNGNVTIDSFKKWGTGKVIIFEGHGAYNSELHSCLVTEERFLGFDEFSKYKEDIEKKNIVLTSFPQIGKTNIPYSPVRKYCITSKFVDNYFEKMNQPLIFLGACSSAKDDVLAQALLNKGAAVVIGYNETTSMEYEMMTRSMFFYALTRVDEQDKDNNITAAEALWYAKNTIGSSDPFGEYGAELVCISRNNIDEKYTLTGIKETGNDQNQDNQNNQNQDGQNQDNQNDQDKNDISYAEQYYEQLVLTEGLADEHIVTKLRTTEGEGASTVCLAPETGKSGIVFKDIADFDQNGIDDLIVVKLNEYEGKMTLDQCVYFFDQEGKYTISSATKDNPINGTCNFYFYKVGNYMVNIYKADYSGDWIDGLRYEVIDNNVQIHDDEIHIMNYDMDGPNNGESIGEILYIHKDSRYPDAVCYTIDDVNGYYAIYNRGFTLSSAEDVCVDSETEGCDSINSLLRDILGEEFGRIEPTSWDDRWNTDFFPDDVLPECYTILKVNANPSYKTGENTTESDISIEAEYVNSR